MSTELLGETLVDRLAIADTIYRYASCIDRRDIEGIRAVLLGHFVFKFHPAILFGVCAGVRTTTAALGMIQEAAKSKVPALGYGMPYAIGNTLLTIFGMVIVLMLVGGS